LRQEGSASSSFSRLAEVLKFGLGHSVSRSAAPLNKKLSGRGKGGDGCGNFSRMF